MPASGEPRSGASKSGACAVSTCCRFRQQTVPRKQPGGVEQCLIPFQNMRRSAQPLLVKAVKAARSVPQATLGRDRPGPGPGGMASHQSR